MMGVKSQKHMGYSLSENAGPWHKYEEFVLDLCKRKSALPKQELLEKWSLVKRHENGGLVVSGEDNMTHGFAFCTSHK